MITIGAPTANAGAILCATRLTGKLNGVIASTGPSGNRLINATRLPSDSSVSRRIRSPSKDRHSSAAHLNVDTARAASTFAHFMGFPPSLQIVSAISSPRSFKRVEMCIKASARA